MYPDESLPQPAEDVQPKADDIKPVRREKAKRQRWEKPSHRDHARQPVLSRRPLNVPPRK